MYRFYVKRLIDILCSFIALVCLAIPFLIIMLIIMLESKGAPLYRQVRVGKNGKLFKIFKFRSMVRNADQIGSYYTNENDIRITKVGKFLRKISLDELPQILNVLLGDMSLIGPRPDVLAQKSLYTESDLQKRCEILPGISGLAQVRNRHGATMKSRLHYDLFYVERISFFLDMKIIWWTIMAVLKGSY
jgi:lipopolysaccharide/colanic/teichoic acid biosynthesis glycosyltransferase